MVITDIRFPPADDPEADTEDYPRTGLDIISLAASRGVPLIVGYTTMKNPGWGAAAAEARNSGAHLFFQRTHFVNEFSASPFPEIIGQFEVRVIGGRSPDAASAAPVGQAVFIGHGGSPLWLELKELVSERLKLPYEEFNRISAAGETHVGRLSKMLDASRVALLVLTAEDEHADGLVVARQNVVHELGLFQGRLGFHRAIVLIEEGCEPFSNIEGLTEIRFPPGKIAAAFEEVRRFLEREGLIG
jgi:predicted nucleotide-binding protein